VQVEELLPVSVFAAICYTLHLAQQTPVLPSAWGSHQGGLANAGGAGGTPLSEMAEGTLQAGLTEGFTGRPVQLG
jgi:hypothetical protein